MTQQEIAFQLGVNQGRVNEVLKHGKWLREDPQSEEAQARDKAKALMKKAKAESVAVSHRKTTAVPEEMPRRPKPKSRNSGQLSIEDYLNVSTPSDQQ
jgi:tRNA(His) 5'-end guanylyltransferase